MSVKDTLSKVSSLATVRSIVREHFPELWPAVEAALAAIATLLLKDNSNPAAVVFVGPPSSSKTTVLEMFADHDICYTSDEFTPASFVSHAASVERKALEETVDLLPRIRHKVLITPELAPVFRGKEDDLVKRFAILTRVLDGQGLMRDSGVHGRRGHRGDYLFTWLGATTPLGPKTWKIMAQLGSRLFFYQMPDRGEVTVEDLLRVTTEVPYRLRLESCKRAVHSFLSELIEVTGGVRGIAWESHDDDDFRAWVARLAKLLAALRGLSALEDDSPSVGEVPYRAHAVLENLARGHALIWGRKYLTTEDLALIAHIAISTIPPPWGVLLKALIAGEGVLTVSQAQKTLPASSADTARKRSQTMGRTLVMKFTEEGVGKTAYLHFRPDWSWCSSPEFKRLLFEG